MRSLGRDLSVVCLCALLGTSLAAVGAEQGTLSPLTDAEVTAAIRAGSNRKAMDKMIESCAAGPTFGESMAAGMAGGVQNNGNYSVTLSLNEGRIAELAAEAKRLYKPFSAADVTQDLREPQVFLSAVANSPARSGNEIKVAAPIDTIVLKSKAHPDNVVRSSDLQIEQKEWSNLLGGKVSGTDAVATFPIDGVNQLASAGDFDVVIVTSAGERRCKIKAKDWRSLAQAAGTSNHQ